MIVEIGSMFEKGDKVIPSVSYFMCRICTVERIEWRDNCRCFYYLVEDEKGQRLWYDEGDLKAEGEWKG